MFVIKNQRDINVIHTSSNLLGDININIGNKKILTRKENVATNNFA